MNEILKKFKIIGEIWSMDYKHSTLIRNLLFNGKIKIKKAEYFEYVKKQFNDIQKDLFFAHTWSTYDKCTEVELHFKEGEIKVNVTIWDGDNLDGHRKAKRWKATFYGFDVGILEEFSYEIERRFKHHVAHLFEKEEEMRKQRRMKEITDMLLK